MRSSIRRFVLTLSQKKINTTVYKYSEDDFLRIEYFMNDSWIVITMFTEKLWVVGIIILCINFELYLQLSENVFALLADAVES